MRGCTFGYDCPRHSPTIPAEARAVTEGEIVAMYAYVGCYTTPDRDGRGNGINVYEMDPQSGAWTHVQLLDGIGNPSWLTVDQSQQHLYSVHGGNGFTQVSAYAIDPSSGKLTPLGSQQCGSPNPVAISISPIAPYAVVAGYNAGKVAALPVNPDGSLGPMSDLVTLVGEPGPHPTEQNVSHPHHIPIDPAGQHFIVPDKGFDRTYVFRVDPANGKIVPSEQASVVARPGRGPAPPRVPPERPRSPTSATRSTRPSPRSATIPPPAASTSSRSRRPCRPASRSATAPPRSRSRRPGGSSTSPIGATTASPSSRVGRGAPAS